MLKASIKVLSVFLLIIPSKVVNSIPLAITGFLFQPIQKYKEKLGNGRKMFPWLLVKWLYATFSVFGVSELSHITDM
jgi:hypothetical protein